MADKIDSTELGIWYAGLSEREKKHVDGLSFEDMIAEFLGAEKGPDRTQRLLDEAHQRALDNPFDPDGSLQAARDASDARRYKPPEKLSLAEVDEEQLADLLDRGYPGKVAVAITTTPALWDMVANGESFEDVVDDLQYAGVDIPTWREVQADRKSHEAWKKKEAEKAAAKEAAAAQEALLRDGDYLTQLQGRWKEGRTGDEQALQDNASKYRKEMEGLGSGYAEALGLSEGYTGLVDYADEMRGIYDLGGLTAQTKANLEKARREEDQWVRAQREAMLQDLAERGMTGGGAEVASSIGDRAAAADRMSARDLETLSFAQQQAIDALTASSEANKTRFGWDKDALDVQRQYFDKGATEEYNAGQAVRDAALKAWNDMFGKWQTTTDNMTSTLATQTANAQPEVVDTISGASSQGKTNVGNVTQSDVGNANNYGGSLGTSAGSYQPPSFVVPGIPSTVDRGADVLGGLDATGKTGAVVVDTVLSEKDSAAANPPKEPPPHDPYDLEPNPYEEEAV